MHDCCHMSAVGSWHVIHFVTWEYYSTMALAVQADNQLRCLGGGRD